MLSAECVFNVIDFTPEHFDYIKAHGTIIFAAQVVVSGTDIPLLFCAVYSFGGCAV